MVEQYENQIAVIRYHVNWPYGNDPFYVYNISENTARKSYYQIDQITYLIVDGIVHGRWDRDIWDSLFVYRIRVDSPFEMVISGYFDEQELEGNIDITVVATDDIEYGNLRFHCVITESDIYYQAPNGLEWHNQTMRDMVPDAGGEAFTIQNGDTLVFDRQFFVPDPLVPLNCEIVVFVQTNETKEVLQAAKIKIPELIETEVAGSTEPLGFDLFHEYPNPFNAHTTIRYSIPIESIVTIEIYNLLGQRVDRIADEKQPAGYHQIIWNAREQSSGIYLYRIQAGEYSETRKMVLLK